MRVLIPLGVLLVAWYVIWVIVQVGYWISERRESRRIRGIVEAGPDCYCGHERKIHTRGVLPALGSFDGLCALCHDCDNNGYVPAGRSYREVMP